MRRQLFKGKRRDTGDWIVGDLSHYKPDKVFIKPVGGSDTSSREVIPVTVGEYTGREDRFKNLIYEHDLVKNSLGNEIGVIRYGEYRNPFNDDSFACHIGFYVEWFSGCYAADLRKELGYWSQYIEVFDNIYNDPDYLAFASGG